MQTTVSPREALAARAANLRSSFFTRERLTDATAILLYLAALDFVAHVAFGNNYGYFRDELYYMAAGRHLAFGYVDFAPFIAWMAALLRFTTNDNLIALHVVSGAASAALVFTTGMIARELGGKRAAQVIAALAALVNITFLAMGSIFSYDAFDELWWALAFYVFIRLMRRNQPRLWLVFGLFAGLDLFTKATGLYFGLALVIALLCTSAGRAQFRTRWIYLGGAIAVAFLVPYILWNTANGAPTLQFYAIYSQRLVIQSPLSFLAQQLYTMNPLTAPLWLVGLWWFLRAPAAKPYRALGVMYLVLFVIFALESAKTYFLAPAYPMLYAAGAGVFERAYERARSGRRWVLPSYVGVMVLTGVLLAPLAMPILPPATWAQAYGFLGGDAGAQMEKHTTGVLPQWLADRFGWDTLTAQVTAVYHALPADEQKQACIIAGNYGEAGAIAYLGAHNNLPPVISTHNNWFVWGPGTCTGSVLIVVGGGFDLSQLQANFGSVRTVGTTSCNYCMPYEDGVPIYVASQPKFPNLRTVWPTIKNYS
ncbi:MAG TPA: glycosyltransferase family 39 protein [Ktedonobacterales bacterium]|nr:glycosyltransferase family 39 protein [Ktedonobacterales bacterium]